MLDAPDVAPLDVADVLDAGERLDASDAADSPSTPETAVDAPDVVDTGPPPCAADAIRCTTDASGVGRCVSAAWQLARVCRTMGLPVGSTAACYMGGCAFCRGVDGGPACGEATCRTDEDYYRGGDGRCIDGGCGRRGILPCASSGDCLPWTLLGVSSDCTLTTTDLNGDTVRSCSGSSVGPCTADHHGTRDFRCEMRTGRCARP